LRHVKGILFADYVRMIRAVKSIDWSSRLVSEDRALLHDKIAPDGWYPMAAFERLGNAILEVVAQGQLELVRMWGRGQADTLRVKQPMLIAAGDPVETLNRFRVLRATYFDFDTLAVPLLHLDEAQILIAYQMGMPAEEAASYQTMGFFERLLELSGAREVSARFSTTSWSGDPRTLLSLHWQPR
jgi:eukaryotic-like serine/threonine-protein kinase